MDPRQVGVIGAGVIGIGVIQDLAQTGHDVTVVDTSEVVLRDAEKAIRRSIRLHHLTAGTNEPLDVGSIMARIQFTKSSGDLRDCQFIIENVTEDWDTKRSVYTDIDGICNSPCIFAANTSVIPITKIAAATSRCD